MEMSVPAPDRDPSARWKELLLRITDKDGIDYEHLARRRGVLEGYLAWVAENGPQGMGLRESQEDEALSTLINAHNAAVLYGVLYSVLHGGLAEGKPERTDDLKVGLWRWPGAGFYHGQHYRIDGEWTGLFLMADQAILGRYQEPLLHAALVYGRRDDPPLRWWPSSGLQATLKRSMRSWLARDETLTIDDDVAVVNPLFVERADDFLYWSDAATVCDWLVDYSLGDTRRWLREHAADCPMSARAPDRSLNERL